MKKNIALLFNILFFISCGRIGEYQVVWKIQKPSQELMVQVFTEIQGIKVINDGNFHNPVKDENAFNNNFKDLLKNKKVEKLKAHPDFIASRYDNNELYYVEFQSSISFLKLQNPSLNLTDAIAFLFKGKYKLLRVKYQDLEPTSIRDDIEARVKVLESPEIAIIYKDGNIKTYQAKMPYLQRDNVIYLERNLTPYYRVIIPYWMYKIQK